MKNAVILHGTGSTPDSFWQPYIRQKLEEKGYVVTIPALPGTDNPYLEEQLVYVLETCAFTGETVMIGHSSGVPLALSVLERVDTTIAQAILVSGFFKPLPDNELCKQMLQTKYNWEMIKSHCRSFTVLNSDNDPWSCDDVMGRELAEHLSGEFVFMKGEGHMGSGTFNQPYLEFPKLLECIY